MAAVAVAVAARNSRLEFEGNNKNKLIDMKNKMRSKVHTAFYSRLQRKLFADVFSLFIYLYLFILTIEMNNFPHTHIHIFLTSTRIQALTFILIFF